MSIFNEKPIVKLLDNDPPEPAADMAHLSVMDLFSIGIGPSSSHTVGPMRAAFRFCEALVAEGVIADVAGARADLYGSLALTGKGHATDTAVMLGLSGFRPRTIDPDAAQKALETARAEHHLILAGRTRIPFVEADHLLFHYGEFKDEHPNAMQITAFDAAGDVLKAQFYYSVGGGFVVTDTEGEAEGAAETETRIPYPFSSAAELLAHGTDSGMKIADIMMANEETVHGREEVETFLKTVKDVMFDCIDRGCKTEGILPGGLKVKRRAYQLHHELVSRPEDAVKDPLTVLDWVNLFALAVNEENAAGGKVVTAPTNGAAGVIPAVLAYYTRFCHAATEKGVVDFLLTAGAIGAIYKKRASLSAAEVGCQGEVGVACSMAAGALCAVLGGTNEQIENAAEIGMEHNLGLTCDPIGGLVQVPCIERNTMGAAKAINAARLALRGDGTHLVSLDSVIETMRQTGLDMQSKYKETSQGGLAVNVVEC